MKKPKGMTKAQLLAAQKKADRMSVAPDGRAVGVGMKHMKLATDSYLDDLTRAWNNLASKDGHWTEENEKAVFAAVSALVCQLREDGGIKLSRDGIEQIVQCVSEQLDKHVERVGEHIERVQSLIKREVIGEKAS